MGVKDETRRFLRCTTRSSIWRDNSLETNELVGDLIGSPVKGAVIREFSGTLGYA